MTKNTSKSNNPLEKKYPIAYLLPLIAILAIIPAIVYCYTYDTGLLQYDWYQGPGEALDFFLHTKMVWLLIVLAVMLFVLIYMIFSEEITPLWDKKLIPLFIYCGLTFLSALFSINRGYSFSGIYEQFESVWVLLGYGLIVYYAFFNLHTEDAVKRIIPFFVGGVTLMCIIGLTQALSADIFRLDFVQKLIQPKEAEKLTFAFEEGRTYLTLYNPNYVGFYAALIVPVLVALLFHTNKLLFRIGYGLLTFSMLFILFASQSRAGIIALAVSFVIMLICMRKVFFKNWIITTAAIGIVVIAFIGINIMNHGVLIDRMKGMFSAEKEMHPLESIVTDKDVTITYNGNDIHFELVKDENKKDSIKITDNTGKAVAVTENTENNTIENTADTTSTDKNTKEATETITPKVTETGSLADDRFPFKYAIMHAEEDGSLLGFQVTIDDKNWYFTNTLMENDSTYYIRALGNALFKLKTHEKGVAFLEEHYHFANMRGYIWARTLPLLKKYFFLGSGPDTFIIAFPNDDLVGLYNSGHDNEIITRPHCMYLQIAVQTGVPSLIAFLTFFIWYICSSLKLYWKQDYSELLPKIGVGILASVIGYMILGLTNDSCIAVSPIFFALAGMGLGINYYLKKQ